MADSGHRFVYHGDEARINTLLAVSSLSIASDNPVEDQEVGFLELAEHIGVVSLKGS